MSITYHSTTCQNCTALQQRIDELLQQIVRLERQGERLSQQLEQVTGEHDLFLRTVTCTGMSPIYRNMFIALNRTYPCLVDGMSTQVSVWKVRQEAGWVSERRAGEFFRDMQSIGVFLYEDGEYDARKNERLGKITPNPEKYPYPETFDTRNSEGARKSRKAAKDRRDLALEALKRRNCENCGEMTLGYIAKCNNCGHVHTQDLPIPVAQIEVIAAKDGEDIDWDKEIEKYEGDAA